MTRIMVAIMTAATLAAGYGPARAAGQDPAPPPGRTWVAVVTSIDDDAERVSFRARASAAAARSAERLVAGEQVRFRWEGPERRRVHRIAEVTPLSTSRGTPKSATARGRFAMNAEFVAVNRRTRMITFSIPVERDWRVALEGMAPAEWLAVQCEIDQEGRISAIVAVDPLRPAARE